MYIIYALHTYDIHTYNTSVTRREVHSWGKNNFLSIKSMASPAVCINDTLLIGAEICSVKEVAHDIEDWGIMPDGRHRCFACTHACARRSSACMC